MFKKQNKKKLSSILADMSDYWEAKISISKLAMVLHGNEIKMKGMLKTINTSLFWKH